MKVERLKQRSKKPIVIGSLLVLVVGGALTFRLTHSKYRTTQSIDLATGTITYTVPDFRIVEIKTSEDKTNYNDVSSVPTSGYVLNTSKSVCNVDNVKDNNITIKYSNGKVNFKNITKKGTKCYLYFDKGITVDNIIAANNPKTTTPDFSKTATTDEGVFSTGDGMYGNTTYYWRGAVTNNYVKFAGFCWRIIRINGDKTIRMIYDGNSCHNNGTSTTENLAVTSQSYSKSSASYYVGWTYDGTQRTISGTASNAKTQTENWYNSNLKSYEGKIADGKFCNDRDVKSGQSWVSIETAFQYAAYERLEDNKTPSLSCPSGDVYTLKVGAIIADEVSFAGGKCWTSDESGNNDKYYLYNGQNYCTMTPAYWNGPSTSAYVYSVYSLGSLNGYNASSTYGLRPVINLKSDVTFSSGNGEQSTPYVVS